MGISRGPNIVTDGLVFIIDAANTKLYISGSTTTTDIINNTTGSWSSTGIFSPNNAGIFVLDGGDDYLTYQPTTLPELGTTYTYGLWIKSTDTQGELFCSFETASPWKGMLFGLGTFGGTDGKLVIWMCNNAGSGAWWKDTGVAVNDGNWKYVVVTYDGSNARFYHNAVLSSTIAASLAVGASIQPFRVGASNNAPDRFYGGSIGPGHIYNRTLSSTEVLQNYNALKGRFGL